MNCRARFQPEIAQLLTENVLKTGFNAVIVDSQGYRQGSLNAALLAKPESITS